ncbi:type II toxin-antitoxin system HipA family toxin [Mycobacterium sp. TNTM28]|uniref:Type II toxin-antitoxin system HipA family toxin n=1 Tax=[Mycobacterium] fortunisiensis TaxID=2600579 RepID=A0ABS6KMT4_9MYCO|nr:type II toxin-antitoxin system HipA family toxin [[Mycobacterium] fortunisiensis]MBU9764925.1 type II toxin-antitoxin system HipA family toxin [[Mycobacterium] fortunisiensis]
MADAIRNDVWLYGNLIGYLHALNNYTWFEFDEAYLRNPDRPVLGLRFEENPRGRVASNLRLAPWFSNLLPEGTLRSWIATDRGVSPEREMELLLQVGHDLPGAVRVLPGGPHTTDELEYLESTMSSPSGEIENHRWRFSLAGVGLKFSMLRSGDRFTCTATGEGGDWILKLPDTIYRNVPTNEYTMMKFAASVGIDAPDVRLVNRDQIDNLPTSVWPGNESWAFAVRRFDRTDDGGLIHIEDLAQVRGVYPARKYEGNFETIAGLVYRGHDSLALQEFVRRLTFFTLIGNGDAHLKNWSLIYHDRRVPTLSPVYDVVATEGYRPSGEPEDLGLKFSGSRRFDSVRVHQFNRLATRLGTNVDLSAVAAETVEQTVQHWPEFREFLADEPLIRNAVDQSIRDRSLSLLRAS